VGFIIGIGIFIVSLGTALSPLVTTNIEMLDGNLFKTCTFSNQLTASFVYMALLGIAGLILGYKVRNLPKHFNEARHITWSTFLFIITGFLVVVIYVLLMSFPNVIYIICVGILLICIAIVWVILFLPKIHRVLKEPNKIGAEWNDSKIQWFEKGTRSNITPMMKFKKTIIRDTNVDIPTKTNSQILEESDDVKEKSLKKSSGAAKAILKLSQTLSRSSKKDQIEEEEGLSTAMVVPEKIRESSEHEEIFN